ncbi:hypothetical protein X801_10050 [Opisthorchis viverrini]|uniref:Uncharacterized protein n=1 Tax=Opisthorchis viverrini TaxID=6198 RepID=A0A1S8WIA6_OPIVI|nr:hypothetical protein X801_10050 [Opisthorchis viverrini]
MDALKGDDTWINNMLALHRLRTLSEDSNIRLGLMRVKMDNKNRFAEYMKHRRNIFVDPSTLFDVMGHFKCA